MALMTSKLAAATAVAAAFSLAATPVVAADLARPAHPDAYDASAENAQRHGHGGYHGHYDDDWDIDTEDVLVGAVVIGALAAIFGAANSHQQQQRYPDPEPEPYPDDAGYQAPVQTDRYASANISTAVDACAAEVESRGDHISTVAGANRTTDGWYVSGELDGGAEYWCRLDDYGQVSAVGGGGVGYAEPVEQYEDEYYNQAREDALEKAQNGG